MAIKLNDEIIHDDESAREVLFNAIVRFETLSKDLDSAIENEYCIRGGKFLEGKDYKNEIIRMKVELEILEKLFDGEKCKKHYQEDAELEDEDEDEDEMET